MSELKPIQNKERIAFLDILRGIAILFIFVGNISFLSGWIYLSQQTKQNLGTYYYDLIIDYLLVIFVQGKFYSIFSILFGISFVILFNKFKDSEKAFKTFYRRRMFGLLLIGLIHLSFFWNGDILTLYALLGFLLIIFRSLKDKSLLIWGFVFLFMPVLSWLFVHLTEIRYYRLFFEAHQSYTSSLKDLPNVFLPFYQIQTENLADFLRLNFGNFFRRFGYFLFEGRQFKVLGCFVLGIWFGRKILYENILENTKLFKKTLLIGLIVGVPMNMFMEYCENQSGNFWRFFYVLSYAIGVISLATAYIALIAIFVNAKFNFLNLFAPVGKMALTNYLLQTFISIGLFYGIGFGLGGKLSLTKTMLVLILIFVFQIVLSWLWLKKFKYGPIEWVWRIMTYRKFFQIKK